MKCVNHPDIDAAGICNKCGKQICDSCRVPFGGESYCKICISEKAGTKAKPVKSPTLAAVLGFCLGGLGQVYNGQTWKGLLIFLTSILVVPWIYGIFDAYSTANKINSGALVVQQRPGCMISAIAFMVITPFFVAILGVLAAIAIPNILAAKTVAQTNLCKNNLEYISLAKEQYITDNNLQPDGIIPDTDNDGNLDGDGIPDVLEVYINRRLTCPLAGLYSVEVSGKNPSCSVGNNNTPRNSDDHILSGK